MLIPGQLATAPVIALLTLSGVWAGAQNALAGGGSFITLPVLILTGLDARTANITSTVALFPSQMTTSWHGREHALGAEALSLRVLAVISLVGGAFGAGLLLLTPSSVFADMLPWLVLLATATFAWGSFGRAPASQRPRLGPIAAGAFQFGIAIYGGYFGGGIGFLMLAVLTMAALPVRIATATKNILAAAMNFTAVIVFLFSGAVRWGPALALGAGAIVGGLIGAWMLHRVNERVLRIVVVLIGVCLTVGLFVAHP